MIISYDAINTPHLVDTRNQSISFRNFSDGVGPKEEIPHHVERKSSRTDNTKPVALYRKISQHAKKLVTTLCDREMREKYNKLCNKEELVLFKRDLKMEETLSSQVMTLCDVILTVCDSKQLKILLSRKDALVFNAFALLISGISKDGKPVLEVSNYGHMLTPLPSNQKFLRHFNIRHSEFASVLKVFQIIMSKEGFLHHLRHI